jgi:hypothetical protein
MTPELLEKALRNISPEDGPDIVPLHIYPPSHDDEVISIVEKLQGMNVQLMMNKRQWDMLHQRMEKQPDGSWRRKR